MKLTLTILLSTNCFFPRNVSLFSRNKYIAKFLYLASNCEHCQVRQKMQQKYLGEAHELYDEFFHIVQLPLLTEEVRGPEKLKAFSKMLVEPYIPSQD